MKTSIHTTVTKHSSNFQSLYYSPSLIQVNATRVSLKFVYFFYSAPFSLSFFFLPCNNLLLAKLFDLHNLRFILHCLYDDDNNNNFGQIIMKHFFIQKLRQKKINKLTQFTDFYFFYIKKINIIGRIVIFLMDSITYLFSLMSERKILRNADIKNEKKNE